MESRSGDAYAVSRRKQGAWRTASLCAQVRRALEIAFGCAADERLTSVWVEEVSPAPNASRLRIVVRCATAPGVDTEDIEAAIAGARGWLRSQVAAAIHRKRTPELHYVLLAQDERCEGAERAPEIA